MPLSSSTIEREAGAIVVRADEAKGRVLLVTSKNNPAHWLFPKGHLEAGETPEQAAVREAVEEAGVRATARKRLGTTSFEHDGRQIEVEYFLCDYDGEQQATEGRRIAWLPVDQAKRRLTFENTRRMLELAEPFLPARHGGGVARRSRQP